MPGAPIQTTAVDRSVLLVQLSDSHLFADGAGKLLGMDTQDSLQRVIERVLQEQPQIDLILASGDLSQDGSAESYQRFREMTAAITAPARWFPGNHDEVPAMQAACAGSDVPLKVACGLLAHQVDGRAGIAHAGQQAGGTAYYFYPLINDHIGNGFTGITGQRPSHRHPINLVFINIETTGAKHITGRIQLFSRHTYSLTHYLINTAKALVDNTL